MKILFVKLGKEITDEEKEKIYLACETLGQKYLGDISGLIIADTISIPNIKPTFETTDFIQGKLTFLSGQTMLSCLNKIDSDNFAPIIVWITDPQPNLANMCYKLINKYGIVNCSVVSDGAMEHYIVHELVHAIHEWLERKE